VSENYFVMQGDSEGKIALLYDLESPSDFDDWLWGQPFRKVPKTPVRATLKSGFDTGEILAFYDAPQIMLRDLHECLVKAGVDNLDVYPAVIDREDGTVVRNDYVAFNVIGKVAAADLKATQFAPENPSRLMDASIEKLTVDESRAHGMLLFRLAESMRILVVHASIKAAVEARGFPGVVFLGTDSFVY
jgi:hypothetical protein